MKTTKCNLCDTEIRNCNFKNTSHLVMDLVHTNHSPLVNGVKSFSLKQMIEQITPDGAIKILIDLCMKRAEIHLN